MQINPVKVSLNFKDGYSRGITEEDKVPSFRGARKTMPSSQKNHPELNVIKINIMASRISTEAEHTSNIVNIGFTPVFPASNSISSRVSGSDFEAEETKTKDSTSSGKQARGENSLKLTYEQKSDKLLSSHCEINSFENEKRIYMKRPTVSGNSPLTDSGKIFIRTTSQAENLRYKINENAEPQTSTDETKKCKDASWNAANKFPDEKMANKKSHLVPPQMRQNASTQGSIHLPNDNRLLPKLQQFRNLPGRQIKAVRFLDKENINPVQGNETHSPDAHTPRRDYETKRPISRIFIQQRSMKGNPSAENRSKENRIPNFSLGKNNLPVTSFGNTPNATGRGHYRMNPPPYKTLKTAIMPFPRSGLMGRTATRNTHQNARNLRVVLFPGMRMQPNPAGYSAKHAKVASIPSSADGNEAEPLGRQHPKGILSGSEPISQSGIIPENAEESVSFQKPKRALICCKNTEPSTSRDGLKELDAKNTDMPVISKKENKGENKILQLVTKLTKISKLLQNVNIQLLSGFECAGLELSLPIWRTELEQCILSAEKVKRALLEHQAMEKGQQSSTPEQ